MFWIREIKMKKVVSSLVISGLCASGACFGMNWDLTETEVDTISTKVRRSKIANKINRKVRKIKKVVKNNRKIQAVLGASAAVASSALAYHYLGATKNSTVNVPVSKISESSVSLLRKAFNLARNYPVATGLITIGGLANITVAMTYFIKSERQENENSIKQRQQILSEELKNMLDSLKFEENTDIPGIDEIERRYIRIKTEIENKTEKDSGTSSAVNGLWNNSMNLNSKIAFLKKVKRMLENLSFIKKSIEDNNWNMIDN